jgi:peptide/nickel transport system permease protein
VSAAVAVEALDLERDRLPAHEERLKGARFTAGFWVGITIIALAVLATVAVRLFSIGQPDALKLTDALSSPSLEHPFGTDALGRDVFLRTVYATGLDLQIGFLTSLMPLIGGMVIGLVAGFYGGRVETLLMRLMDVLLAFPFLVLILAFVSIFGAGTTGIYVGLTVAGVPIFARLTRGEMLVLREQQFMMAAQTLGYSSRRIVFRHALPHVIRPIMVYMPSNMLGNVLTIAALSYLGLGTQPPTPEWGAIIAGGQPYLLSAWWISTLPGLFVVVVGLGLALTSESLAERLRVQMR